MIQELPGRWKQFATALAQFNTRMLLSIVFFIAIVPLGLFLRLLGKSILRRPDSGSLWIKKNDAASPEKPF